MASLDRQVLLEQKRKRLQELKERRSGVSLVDTTQPNLAIAEAEPARAKVDFAVQVDLIQPSVVHHVSPPVKPQVHLESFGVRQNDKAPSRSVIKFDKTVQTHFELLVDFPADDASANDDVTGDPKEQIEPETLPPPPESDEPQKNEITEKKVEQSIHEFLYDSGFRFSDLRLGIKQEKSANLDIVTPFNVAKSVCGFVNRPVSAITLTPEHPDVFLAAYGKPAAPLRARKRPLTMLAGLAVLFNKSSGAVVPEFFLQCTSYIRMIVFDKTNPFKIFAGLENGRVVMWDLSNVNPTQVAVLPTLQTSTVASLAAKMQHKFTHHVAPIVHIAQLNAESSLSSGILSICRDGVVNLWSPNFLAFPKIASLRLTDEDAGRKVPFRLTDALLVLTMLRVSGHPGHQNLPEYNFLNLTVVASEDGTIYKLGNVKERLYIRARLPASSTTEGPSARSIASIVELRYNATTTFLLSAHSDWSLRFWDMESCRQLHVLPTSTLVSSIVARPGHGSQFITIGTLLPLKIGLFVEFWDIKAKLLSPISKIPTRERKSGAALFNADGSEMILAYDNGEIDIFNIEESLLASQVQAQAYVSFDEGIDKLLSSL